MQTDIVAPEQHLKYKIEEVIQKEGYKSESIKGKMYKITKNGKTKLKRYNNLTRYLHKPEKVEEAKDEVTEKLDTLWTNTKSKRPIPWKDGKWGKSKFVNISNDGKDVTFSMQKGNYSTDGYNGCYAVELISFATCLYRKYAKEQPSRETSLILTKLEEALLWDVMRSKNREIEGSWGKGDSK